MKTKIDPLKTYTCNGKRVVGIRIMRHNSLGNEVTYPVKGTIILREKPLKTEYAVWSIYGEANVVWHTGHNLREVQE